jgi:hypothetical protein
MLFPPSSLFLCCHQSPWVCDSPILNNLSCPPGPTQQCLLPFNHFPPTHPLAVKMSTLASIKTIVKEISTLSSTLTDSVPKGSKDDKIWRIMNTKELDMPHETFNRRFDALFGEDCRDPHGRLHHVCQGKLGMGLIVLYLSKINWDSFPLDLVELKLQRLITELKYLQCVLISFHL